MNNKRQQATKEKSAKPKVAKGCEKRRRRRARNQQKRSRAEIERRLTEVRCEQRPMGHATDRGRGARLGRSGAGSRSTFKDVSQKARLPETSRSDYDSEITPSNSGRRQSEKGMHGVAPEMADFWTRVKADTTRVIQRPVNYGGHGGGLGRAKAFRRSDRFGTDRTGGLWQATAPQ